MSLKGLNGHELFMSPKVVKLCFTQVVLGSLKIDSSKFKKAEFLWRAREHWPCSEFKARSSIERKIDAV